MVIVLCLVLLVSQTQEEHLPKWMTPEESLRVDEIGESHVVTDPPEGWVETPAEFEELKGVFVTWIWGWYNQVHREIVREVVEVAKAYIIVGTSGEQSSITSYLQSGGVPLDSVVFMMYPRNSVWVRDYGPCFIHEEGNTEGIVDFIYNRPRPLDDTIPWRIGQDWGIPVYGSPLTHEGGNFMVDGVGTGFASTLIYQDNPSHTPEDIDSLMLAYNGLEQLIVLPRINIEYTGHLDLWTKILNDTLVMVGEYAAGHPNHEILNENADSISRCKNREGYPYRVARIPMPWSMASAPPSYLNSLFVNGKVLVPLWGETEDDTALFIYGELLPDHEIVGIDCSSMSGSGGAIHCITMEAASAKFIHVKHYPLGNTQDTLNPYRVRAQIITSSELLTDSTQVFYRVNSTPTFENTPLSAVIDTPGVYAGYIPAQSAGDTVHYYILAKNNDGVRRTSPVHAPSHIYSFLVSPDMVTFIRGDANTDMLVDISDYLFILQYLNISRNSTPLCMDAADGNDDGFVTGTDAVYLLDFLSTSANPPPSHPYPNCGDDSTSDAIDCVYHPCSGTLEMLHGGSMAVTDVITRPSRIGHFQIRGSNTDTIKAYQVCMNFNPTIFRVDSLTLNGCLEIEPDHFLIDTSNVAGWLTTIVVLDTSHLPFDDEPLLNVWYTTLGDSLVSSALDLADSTQPTGRCDLKCIYTKFSPSYSLHPAIIDGSFDILPEYFIRGDVDGSGSLSLSDGIRCLRCQFVPGWPDSCKCDDAADADDNGMVSIGDCLRILRKQFVPGWQDSIPPPCCTAPQDCGSDPTDDDLGCESSPQCETVKISAEGIQEAMQNSHKKE